MFISDSADATIAAGAACGRLAKVGDVFALTGDLGAGKTQFVKGFVAGVGSDAPVTSRLNAGVELEKLRQAQQAVQLMA